MKVYRQFLPSQWCDLTCHERSLYRSKYIVAMGQRGDVTLYIKEELPTGAISLQPIIAHQAGKPVVINEEVSNSLYEKINELTLKTYETT